MDSVNFSRFNNHGKVENTDTETERKKMDEKSKIGEDFSELNKSVEKIFKDSSGVRNSDLLKGKNTENIKLQKITFLTTKEGEPGVEFEIRQLLEELETRTEGSEAKFQELVRELFVYPEKVSWESGSTDTTTSKINRVSEGILSSSGIKKLKPKPKTLGSRKAQLASLLHLSVVPTAPNQTIIIHGKQFNPETLLAFYKENNAEKKDLVAKHLPLEMVSQISTQARKYPIIQAAVKKIRQNLEKWDDLVLSNDQAGFDNLKGKVEQQMKNLAALSDIISDATQNPDDARALVTLVLDQMVPVSSQKENEVNKSFKDLVKLYLDGDGNLSNPLAKAVVGGVIKHKLSHVKAELPKQPTTDAEFKEITAELTEKRGKAPVTTKAIQLQAELHHAIRTGKIWAAGKNKIKKQGNSANQVFKLRNSATSSKKFPAAAFFKVGAGGEEAAGVMETIIWQYAVMLGLEGHFVPTGETDVRDKSQLTGGKEKVMLWKKSEKEVLDVGVVKEVQLDVGVVEEVQKPRRGGIQVAQKGQVLRDFMINPGVDMASISKSEISKGILVSVVFGMFDAHDKNIFVTEDGKIKYFDNTRSLPNTGTPILEKNSQFFFMT